jgi:hypothetical protein
MGTPAKVAFRSGLTFGAAQHLQRVLQPSPKLPLNGPGLHGFSQEPGCFGGGFQIQAH